MSCPRCQKPLVEIFTAAGVILDVCGACHGTWFDRGEIVAFAADKQRFAKSVDAGLIDRRTSKLACPRCGDNLEEGGLVTPALVVDECPHCHGFWVDRPMLERAFELEGGLGDPHHGHAKPDLLAEVDHVHEEAPAAGGALAGAAAMAMPALPSMLLRSALVMGGLYSLLFLFVLVITVASGGELWVAVLLTVLCAIFQFGIAPYVTDMVLRGFHTMHWASKSELPEHLVAFLDRVCREQEIPFPTVGVIEDGNPNAFTYGHTPRNARLVVTRGLLDMLSPAELEAVVAHEVGHVVHWDMLVMTAATLVPMVLFVIYDVCRRIKTNNDKNNPFPLIALAAYVCYVIGEYVVLFLSRCREYHADNFSAHVTRNPAALASALVKVAYGLFTVHAQQVNEHREAAATGTAGRHPPGMAVVNSMGIFDSHSARALVSASGYSAEQNNEALLGAMQWDLWNPWATYYEIHSTHPLPAHRLDMLGRLSFRYGQKPFVLFDRKKPESFLDEFLVDVCVLALPLWMPAACAIAAAMAHQPEPRIGALALAGLGLGMFLRVLFRYRGAAFPRYSVAGLLSHVKVSGVRPVPVTIEGEVIGKGVPGLIWNEDVVIRDRTGIIQLDYRQPLGVMEWWFGLTKAQGLQGTKVKATGWYRRAPVPYVELHSLECADGTVHRCYTRVAKLAFSLAVLFFGVLATFGN